MKKQVDVNNIINLYNDGLSITKIGDQLNLSRQYVSRLLKNNGIDIALQPTKVNIDEKEVCTLYKSGLSITKIAELYSVSMKPIKRILKENNVTITGKDNRKHTCTYDYFERIDNEHKAYWLGFIMADGNVRIENNKKYVLEIGLKDDDNEHLNKFLKDINSTDTVTYKMNGIYKSCRVMIRSKKLVTDLISLGCTERKSLTLKFPTIDEKLLRHFIRGYFDGDGSVYFNNNSKKIAFNLLGTDDFLNNCYRIFNENTGITITKLYEKKNCKTKFILKHGKQAILILDWLYKDNTICLDRKYIKYKELYCRLK